MNDERFERDVASWVKGEDRAPADTGASVRRAVGAASRTRQLSRRWWLPPFVHRLPPTPPETVVSDDDAGRQGVDDAAGRSSDDRGMAPVSARTSSAFSPITVVAVAVLAFALVGLVFLLRPGGESESPGVATVQIERPVPFTARMGPGPELREMLCEVVEGTKVCRGLGHSWFISDVSEPMLDGEMVVGNNRDEYPGNRWFMTWTYRIENADGAWEGSAHTSTLMSSRGGPHSVVLEGEGGLRRPVRVDGHDRLGRHHRRHLPRTTAGGADRARGHPRAVASRPGGRRAKMDKSRHASRSSL